MKMKTLFLLAALVMSGNAMATSGRSDTFTLTCCAPKSGGGAAGWQTGNVCSSGHSGAKTTECPAITIPS